MRFLREVIGDIQKGENLDLYATVAVSVVLVVLNIFGVALPLAAPLSLGILALLAVAILGNRHRLDVILRNVAEGTHDVFYVDFPERLQQEMVERMEQSADLLIIGIDLDRTLAIHYHLFEQKLLKGHRIRSVLVDPDSHACEAVVRRRYRPSTLESQSSQIRSSLEALRGLQERTSGNLETRVIDYCLAHGAIAADLDAPNGALYIWNYSFKTHGETCPKFVFRTADGYWFDFYREEACAIWDEAVPWHSANSKDG